MASMLHIAGGIVLAVFALNLIAAISRSIDASRRQARSLREVRRVIEEDRADRDRLFRMTDEELAAERAKHRATFGVGPASPTYSRAIEIEGYRRLLAQDPERARAVYPRSAKLQREADARLAREELGRRIGRGFRHAVRRAFRFGYAQHRTPPAPPPADGDAPSAPPAPPPQKPDTFNMTHLAWGVQEEAKRRIEEEADRRDREQFLLRMKQERARRATLTEF
jgi:hypothetical protein